VKERRAALDVTPEEDDGSHDGPTVAACRTYGPDIVRAADAASAQLTLSGDERVALLLGDGRVCSDMRETAGLRVEVDMSTR